MTTQKTVFGGTLCLVGILMATAAHAFVASGSYSFVSNDCEDDGGTIIITESGPNLTFEGGFDKGPSPYYGTIFGSNVTFTHADGDCTGKIQGNSFSGTCVFPEEVCTFEYINME